MTEEMKNIKNLFKAYEEATKAADIAEELYSQDCENEELETAFDLAYERQFKAMDELVDGIVKFTAGRINGRTARTMIIMKQDNLRAIIEKIA